MNSLIASDVARVTRDRYYKSGPVILNSARFIPLVMRRKGGQKEEEEAADKICGQCGRYAVTREVMPEQI